MFGRMDITLFARAMAAFVLVFAAGCGREEPSRTPVSSPEERLAAHRAETAEIHAGMADMRLAQRGLAVAERRLAAVRAEAKAALGGEPSEERVLAEIEAHGAKYPDWARAQADRAECLKRIEAGRAKGLADVRQRLLKRQAEQAGHAAKTASAK